MPQCRSVEHGQTQLDHVNDRLGADAQNDIQYHETYKHRRIAFHIPESNAGIGRFPVRSINADYRLHKVDGV